jgi:hypothetical protein
VSRVFPNTTFRKVNLFPSSDVAEEMSLLNSTHYKELVSVTGPVIESDSDGSN